MPMFPLGTVLFPYAMLPLRVFEPRYQVMTRRVLRGDGEFGVVLIERGSEVGGGETRFHIGTIARIVRSVPLPDGGFALSTVGVRRVQVTRWLTDDPFPRAEVTDFPESPSDADDERRRTRALDAMSEVFALHRRFDPRLPDLPVVSDDPGRAAYELAAIAPIGPLDAQRLLETPAAGDRLALLTELLDEHARYLRADPRLPGEPG